ncbi:hypothetical protein PROFUN_02116 [Planoprotostelium fungivorum]|uniref:Uncharacterized protein n=1 Tax=Planoprotostelium fungivorum TaxID=1890364 RepID=A0A2P6NZ64_9EUKA|nr:hypothetical protein PROFUN_02116 [Planoprotostelium fungivorum]
MNQLSFNPGNSDASVSTHGPELHIAIVRAPLSFRISERRDLKASLFATTMSRGGLRLHRWPWQSTSVWSCEGFSSIICTGRPGTWRYRDAPEFSIKEEESTTFALSSGSTLLPWREKRPLSRNHMERMEYQNVNLERDSFRTAVLRFDRAREGEKDTEVSSTHRRNFPSLTSMDIHFSSRQRHCFSPTFRFVPL